MGSDMVREYLENLFDDILDAGGREMVIDYAIKHMTDATPEARKYLKKNMKRYISINGFRNLSKVPNEILINKVIASNEKHEELERAIFRVWLNLQAKLRLSTEQLVKQYEEPLQVLDDKHNSDNEEKLHSIVSKIISKLMEEHTYSGQEARVMTLFIAQKNLKRLQSVNESEDADEQDYKTEVLDSMDENANVDFNHWLLLLETIPASSEIWLITDDFAHSLIELTKRKVQEQKDAQGIIETLEGFKERCSQEIAYHEMFSANEWSTEKLNLLQFENVVADLQGFEQLLKERAELMLKPVLNKHEEQQLRDLLDDIDEKIESMFKQLDAQLNILGNETSKESVSEVSEESTATQDDSKIIDSKPVALEQMGDSNNNETVNIQAGKDRDEHKESELPETEVVSTENNKTDASVQKINDKSTEVLTVLTMPETTTKQDFESPQEKEQLITFIEGNSDISATETKKEETTNQEGLGIGSESYETQAPINSQIKGPHSKPSNEVVTGDDARDANLSHLYGEILDACMKPSLYPRAWLLIKCYEAYGGIKENIEKLPTAPLLELAYIAQRVYMNPSLYSTYRTHIEQIDVALDAPSFSKDQAFMYFATALPLSLVYDCTFLRSSFYYADNVPEPFQDIYSSLVEKASKVTIPIRDLRGTEEKQRLNQQQRIKLADELLLVFNRATMKSKTKMDDYFFPRYGNGPLQWVKNAVEAEECNEEFIHRLESANAEVIFSEFTDPKWAGITALRERTVERINNIITLAKAWAGTFTETITPDDYQLAAFRELTCLLEENYDQWVIKLNEHVDGPIIAAKWMKQSLEQLLEQIRGVNYAVECAG